MPGPYCSPDGGSGSASCENSAPYLVFGAEKHGFSGINYNGWLDEVRGGGSAGQIFFGGAPPAGPVWSAESPFGAPPAIPGIGLPGVAAAAGILLATGLGRLSRRGRASARAPCPAGCRG